MRNTFTLIFCAFAFVSQGQEKWDDNYPLQDALFSNSFDKYQHLALFRPYILNAPFVDSTSNLYTREAVIAQFNARAPKQAKAQIDPNDIYPVFTADRLDRFVFIVDMPSMTKAQEDSCYSFLAYFHSQLKGGESMDIFRWDENKELSYTEAQHIAVSVPPLDSGDPELWIRQPYNPAWDASIRKHDLSWIIDVLLGAEGQSSTGYPANSLPVTLSNIFIYMGNTGNYSGARSEMSRIDISCRANVRYLCVIDLGNGDTANDFRTMATYAGANPLSLRRGNETIAEYVLFRLVEHYEFRKPEKNCETPVHSARPWPVSGW